MYHALWHFVRTERLWDDLEPEVMNSLIQQGWQAPRFQEEPNAGIDFLYMHRRMIDMVNAWAAADALAVDGQDPNGDLQPPPAAPRGDFVRAWITIPWDHQDPVWPMPVVDLSAAPNLPLIFGPTKEQATTDFYRQRLLDQFDNPTWLRSQSIDQLGTALEFTIHGWMHMHWSPAPPPDPNTLDVNNDWLGSPFSSHVNRHFWKVHGWIDDRIAAWEDAHGQLADLSAGWDGPPDSVTGLHHRADPAFFGMLRMDERPPLLMPWKDLLLEATLQPAA